MCVFGTFVVELCVELVLMSTTESTITKKKNSYSDGTYFLHFLKQKKIEKLNKLDSMFT